MDIKAKNEIKLDRAYNTIETVVKDLYNLYVNKSLTSRDIALWHDIVKTNYFVTSIKFHQGYSTLKLLDISPGNGGIRYVSEPELLGLFKNYTRQDLEDLLNVKDSLPSRNCMPTPGERTRDTRSDFYDPEKDPRNEIIIPNYSENQVSTECQTSVYRMDQEFESTPDGEEGRITGYRRDKNPFGRLTLLSGPDLDISEITFIPNAFISPIDPNSPGDLEGSGCFYIEFKTPECKNRKDIGILLNGELIYPEFDEDSGRLYYPANEDILNQMQSESVTFSIEVCCLKLFLIITSPEKPELNYYTSDIVGSPATVSNPEASCDTHLHIPKISVTELDNSSFEGESLPRWAVKSNDDVRRLTFRDNSKKDFVAVEVVSENLKSLNRTFANTSLEYFRVKPTHFADVWDFRSAWENTRIVEFPVINTSNGELFGAAWRGCRKMTKFPALDFSKASSVEMAWEGCEGLRYFTAKNLNAYTYDCAWKNCSNLIFIDFDRDNINFERTRSLRGTWEGCESLALSIDINSTACKNFEGTWRNCTSLSFIYNIQTGRGVNFTETWRNSFVVYMPPINTRSGLLFRRTWQDCRGLSSFPTIDMTSEPGFYLEKSPRIINKTWFGCDRLPHCPYDYEVIKPKISVIEEKPCDEFIGTEPPILNKINLAILVFSEEKPKFKVTPETAKVEVQFLVESGPSRFQADYPKIWQISTEDRVNHIEFLSGQPSIKKLFVIVDNLKSLENSFSNLIGLEQFYTVGNSFKSVTNFNYAWKNCYSLESFSEGDFSSGETFISTWKNCVSLKKLPKLSLDSGKTFIETWNGTGLIEFKNDLPAAQILDRTWINTNLEICPTEDKDVLISESASKSNVCDVDTDLLIYVTSPEKPVIDYTAGIVIKEVSSTGDKIWELRSIQRVDSFKFIDSPSNAKITAIEIVSENLTKLKDTFKNLVSMKTFKTSPNAFRKVSIFDGAWENCRSLVEFPFINTNKGYSFVNTWKGCTSLTMFPTLNFSSAVYLDGAWANNISMITFPEIDTSSVISMKATWLNNMMLTEFPEIDTSNVVNFESAWEGNHLLKSFPKLDTGSGRNFNRTWMNNTSLEFFPALDFSNVETLIDTWSGDILLSECPTLLGCIRFKIDTENACREICNCSAESFWFKNDQELPTLIATEGIHFGNQNEDTDLEIVPTIR